MSAIVSSGRNLQKDPSLWLLLLTNTIAILLANLQRWSLMNVLLVYWLQSITIGIFNFLRILNLKEFSTEGVTINDRPVAPTHKTKIQIAIFFLIHYGFFHATYLALILSGTFTQGNPIGQDVMEWHFIMLTAALFFLNHLYSYLYNRPRDTHKQNIGFLMLFPYARILPMHFIVAVGSSMRGFLILKTLADAIMHIWEHTILRKGETLPAR
ncbi:MAG: DUF6498-containing protein [Candidatus Peribacteraceae bacterium]|nr:DUF6498-containing protein [Candidatus Peribacteraceae bacterium]MDD5742389.1 DUF6498-containing protein [Candidatus Peribacteraceae bacterium]